MPWVFALVVGLASEDQGDAGRIERDGGDDRVCLIAGLHGLAGHDHDFVAVDGAGLVRLGAANDDAVGSLFDDVGEHIGVRLLAGALRAVAFDIGHAADEHEVFVLDPGQILLQPLEIVRPALLVDLVGGDVERVEGVEADAALETTGGFVADGAQHLNFFDEIVDRLMDVGEAADPVAGEVALGREQVFEFRSQRHLVGLGGGVDVRKEGREGAAVGDLFAHEVDVYRLLAQALDVILLGFDLHYYCSP